jgi:hypothetical protein
VGEYAAVPITSPSFIETCDTLDISRDGFTEVDRIFGLGTFDSIIARTSEARRASRENALLDV